MRAKLSLIVSGGTASGKTTMLGALSAFIPPDERIITIEDAAELALQQEHVVQLESRPANIEGRGQVTIRDLVRNALRMRPDRIVVGEVRGGEALDMLQAMNTGHEGSLTTVHANGPYDALSRLETLASMSEVDIPFQALRDQVNSAVDLVVQLQRFSDGTRRVTEVGYLTSAPARGVRAAHGRLVRPPARTLPALGAARRAGGPAAPRRRGRAARLGRRGRAGRWRLVLLVVLAGTLLAVAAVLLGAARPGVRVGGAAADRQLDRGRGRPRAPRLPAGAARPGAPGARGPAGGWSAS